MVELDEKPGENEESETFLQPEKPSPIPFKKTLPIWIILLSDSFVSSSIYSYSGFMILDFEVTKNKEDVGYYAGFLASAFFFAQTISSITWGKLSDCYGRKPILMMGLVGSFICSIAFGFSFSFWWAIVTRLLSGLLNGNVCVAKTYLGHIVDKTNQTKIFGFVGMLWGLGGIIGSTLGGILARPAEKWPNYFPEDSVWAEFPYLIPNLLAAFISFVGLILAYLFLEESESKSFENASQIKELELHSYSPETKTRKLFQREYDTAILLTSTEEYPNSSPAIPSSVFFFSTQFDLLDKVVKKDSILNNMPIIMTCTMYSLVGLTFTVLNEIVPLWSMLPYSSGGISFNTSSIGLLNGFGGIIVVFLNWAYIPIAERFGLITTFKMATLLGTFCFYLIPMTHEAYVFHQNLVWPFLLFAIFLRQLSAQLAFSAVMNLISNTVLPTHLGIVNGLAQSSVSALRSLGKKAYDSLILRHNKVLQLVQLFLLGVPHLIYLFL